MNEETFEIMEQPQKRKKNSVAIAGFVLSCITLVCGFGGFAPLLMSFLFSVLFIASLVLSIIGMCRKPKLFAILGLSFTLVSGLLFAACAIVSFSISIAITTFNFFTFIFTFMLEMLSAFIEPLFSLFLF